ASVDMAIVCEGWMRLMPSAKKAMGLPCSMLSHAEGCARAKRAGPYAGKRTSQGEKREVGPGRARPSRHGQRRRSEPPTEPPTARGPQRELRPRATTGPLRGARAHARQVAGSQQPGSLPTRDYLSS